MWIKPSSRKELIDLASPVRRPVAGASEIGRTGTVQIKQLGGTELFFLWDENPEKAAQFPSAIVIPEPEQREFFAWTATFLEYFRPLTAYSRVLDINLLPLLLNEGPWLPAQDRLQLPFVGLILGEVLGELEARTELANIFPIACFSTYSYVAARSLVVLPLLCDPATLAQKWSGALRLTGQPRRRLSPGALEQVWAVALRAAADLFAPVPVSHLHVNEKLVEAAQELFRSGDIDVRTWRRLTNNIAEFDRVRESMRGSREERVLSCERALDTLRRLGPGEMIPADFLAGYLVSRINPGTLEHVPLLRHHLADFPMATLWYGFCAGCQPNGEILNVGNGLGRRVLRDVVLPERIWGRPSCDIALSELQVLANDGGQAVSFRQERSGYLKVELVPGVCVHLRSPDADEDRLEDHDTASLARQLDELVWRMYELRRRLLPGYPSPDDTGRQTKRGRRKGY